MYASFFFSAYVCNILTPEHGPIDSHVAITCSLAIKFFFYLPFRPELLRLYNTWGVMKEQNKKKIMAVQGEVTRMQ